MDLQQIHTIIADHLAEIQSLFKEGCTLTLVMCNPYAKDGDLIIGNHTSVDAVIETLQKDKDGHMSESYVYPKQKQ